MAQTQYDQQQAEALTSDPQVKEQRDRFDYALQQWKENRQQAKTDVRFLAGDPWDADEKKARKDEGRPALVFDELNQWTNGLINEVRQNKRAVQVDPRGNSPMNDTEAKVRGAIIRNIEYASNGQAAYITGFESAVDRGFGFWGYRTLYENDQDFDLTCGIRRFPNQDGVVIDPDFKEADASDMSYAFVVDWMPRREYKKRFPKAKITDFSTEMAVKFPAWVNEQEVQIAEYYDRTFEKTRLIAGMLPGGKEQQIFREDELPKDVKFADLEKNGMVKKVRWVQKPVVTKCLTNGLEVLEETEWPGKWIPLCVVLGKEIWVDYGSGPERVTQSLIRLARDSQKLLNYYRTAEAEEAAMTPKVPYIGIKGQFSGNEQSWQAAGKQPLAYLEFNAKTEATGEAILGPPVRQPFQPNFQSYEIAADASRRGIMSAVGVAPLPTAAQRSNEKSGVALERIQSQSQLGSFHFIDNFDRALEHGGRILDDLITKVYDNERSVGTRDDQGKYKVQKINHPDDPDSIMLTGTLGVITIKTGPSYDSQREAADDFTELLAKIPGVFPQIADLIVKLKNLGPIGDAIAERLTPPEYRSKDGQPPLTPQQAQQLQTMVAHLKALNAVVDIRDKEIAELKQERDGKILDNEGKARIAGINAASSEAVAMIKAGQAQFETLLAEKMKEIESVFQAAHEAALQDAQHAHEADQAAAAAEAAAAQQAAQPQPGATPQPGGDQGAGAQPNAS